MAKRFCVQCGTLLPEEGVCLRCGAVYSFADDGTLIVHPRKVKKVKVKASPKKRVFAKRAVDPHEADTQTIPIPEDVFSYSKRPGDEEKHADWTGNNTDDVSFEKEEYEYTPNFVLRDEEKRADEPFPEYDDNETFLSSGFSEADNSIQRNENGMSTWAKSILFFVVALLTMLLVYLLLAQNHQNGVRISSQSETTVVNLTTTISQSTTTESIDDQSNEYVTMPYVLNMQVEEARKLLEEKGFVIDEYAFHYSYQSADIGLVRFATLRAGHEYPKGTHVTLQVWTSESVESKTTLLYADERPVTVPQYKGLYYPDIKQDLAESSDFEYEIEEGDYIYSGSTGTIVDQYPIAGKVVPAGTKVKLYVAKRPSRTTTWVEGQRIKEN